MCLASFSAVVGRLLRLAFLTALPVMICLGLFPINASPRAGRMSTHLHGTIIHILCFLTLENPLNSIETTSGMAWAGAHDVQRLVPTQWRIPGGGGIWSRVPP